MKRKRLILRVALASTLCCAVCMLFSACKQTMYKDLDKSLLGEWRFVEYNNQTLTITDDAFRVYVNHNLQLPAIRSYRWVASDTIELTQIGFGQIVTRNKVTFHSSSRVTIENWFVGNDFADAPVYDDIIIQRIFE